MTTKEEVMAKYRQEKALSTDLHSIVNILTTSPAKDDSEAEWERVLESDSAWLGFQNKYSQDLLDDISDAVDGLIDSFAERIVDGDYTE